MFGDHAGYHAFEMRDSAGTRVTRAAHQEQCHNKMDTAVCVQMGADSLPSKCLCVRRVTDPKKSEGDFVLPDGS